MPILLSSGGAVLAFDVDIQTFTCTENCVAESIGLSVFGTVFAFLISGYPLRWLIKKRAEHIWHNQPGIDLPWLERFHFHAPILSLAIVLIVCGLFFAILWATVS